MKDTKYLIFERREISGRITPIVIVWSNNPHGQILGQIKWFGRWRQFAFFPSVDRQTIFNKECMNDICEVIEELMVERRDKKANS